MEDLRSKINILVDEFASKKFVQKKFEPGKTHIPPSGKKLGTEELKLMVNASLDGWLTTGKYNSEFENKLAKFINVKKLITVKTLKKRLLIWPSLL